MKDESRAKWPEGMTGLRIRDGNNRLAYLIGGNETTDAMVWSEDTDIIEARAKQVRALPAMVALLKELPALLPLRGSAKETAGIVEIAKRARAILAQIGEGE